ncbi:serine/threonine protein phosphatase [Dactylosporangium sp. NPDC051541]|uniref:serine/threonine protein phosphatase n=1 Tax=Dactylosporangium sp. NPDC051541 TaxID=3363977 RepID=UPI00379F1126
MLRERRRRGGRVSGALGACRDDELAALVAAAPDGAVGVGGGCSVLDVDGVAVFVKRIPITARELARPRSTANLFDVPVCCQYGIYRIAGPGFGAWRELAANEVVTAGVLAGETAHFPVLYHWRVLPDRPAVAAEHVDVEAVVAQFGGDPGVRARLAELAAATSSLVLFAEYVPRPVDDWLRDPLGRAEVFERQLLEAAGFLRRREVLHMDGHFGNVRADDERIYLVDFGLATSPRFELSGAEREFVGRHAGHDADYAVMWLVNWLVTTVCGVSVEDGFGARDAYVRRCAGGDIPADVPAVVAGILGRHAATAVRMNAFCLRLYFDGDLDARYPARPGA